MPTYDYKCCTCGHRWEGVAKMNDPRPPCEKCGGESEKVFGAVKAHFKGGGWAADNYSSIKPPMTVNQMLDKGGK